MCWTAAFRCHWCSALAKINVLQTSLVSNSSLAPKKPHAEKSLGVTIVFRCNADDCMVQFLQADGDAKHTLSSRTVELCLLCHQQPVTRSAIVSNFVWFGLKFPTAMFHQSICLWISQIRNLQEIELRCILIRNDRILTKLTAHFGQFAATARRTAHNKPSPKDPNCSFFSSQSSRLSPLLIVSTRGTKWNAA